MNIWVECRTRFDITPSGIRNHYRAHQLPGQDELGRHIPDQAAWIRARNQQRNWDTLNQIISLRCLPENISSPKKLTEPAGTHWVFRFEIMDAAAVSSPQDPVGLLAADSKGVPMITGLDEDSGIGTVLEPDTGGNITFSIDHGK